MYVHLDANWPNFNWDKEKLTETLAEVRYLQGRLLGRMEALGFPLREEASLQILTQDVLKTSEIEGESLNLEQVRSSLARRLGIDTAGTLQTSRNIEGIVEMILDATHNNQTQLTEDRLFGWHASLFPTGRSGMHQIIVGAWRTQASGPMQVISGAFGLEKIHFEAPEYDRVQKEIAQFIQWFNNSTEIDMVIKSAIAHFWFVTIHPFEDGNGRIARALADMLLARCEKSKERFYSMSSQIQRERKAYYDILEDCQKGTLNITAWIEWFLNCLKHSIIASDKGLDFVLNKARFWAKHSNESFNERQRTMLNKLLDGSFIGKLNSSKWAKITKYSQDSALRDISNLIERDILRKEEAGGRSTNYQLAANIA